ncbi:TetR/AcrR family transcriptional regulator [Nocardia transvalensis]|uniref:TetR/AcrR family transcriptional regulator n=1 Tax=Nocardia transvalensis TaxID=37333 RepID=UPI001893085B|nr:TetR/AcrR family transcriptional regulator [Nocardia transvalensis]MBF6331108.1 TetR/AcrR family transcriptional regulator [Nocardia transvalensis]
MARTRVTTKALVEAAAEMADEIGFDNVTVLALARRFGVKDASLYSHVKNVRELRERVAALALTELADQAADALAGRAGKDALVAFASTYRDYAKKHPGRYAAGQLDIDADSPAADPARRNAELTRALLRGYDLPEPDQTDAVRFVNGTLHGYVSLEKTGAFRHTQRDIELSWSKALDALDTVLENWPATAAELTP